MCATSVCPGPIHTAATTEHADREHKSVDELVESQFAGHLILKRLGACNEVADAVVFLVRRHPLTCMGAVALDASGLRVSYRWLTPAANSLGHGALAVQASDDASYITATSLMVDGGYGSI